MNKFQTHSLLLSIHTYSFLSLLYLTFLNASGVGQLINGWLIILATSWPYPWPDASEENVPPTALNQSLLAVMPIIQILPNRTWKSRNVQLLERLLIIIYN